jgi:ABC-type proline/glycine betaine transport system substrate-binding protein
MNVTDEQIDRLVMDLDGTSEEYAEAWLADQRKIVRDWLASVAPKRDMHHPTTKIPPMKEKP